MCTDTFEFTDFKPAENPEVQIGIVSWGTSERYGAGESTQIGVTSFGSSAGCEQGVPNSVGDPDNLETVEECSMIGIYDM